MRHGFGCEDFWRVLCERGDNAKCVPPDLFVVKEAGKRVRPKYLV